MAGKNDSTRVTRTTRAPKGSVLEMARPRSIFCRSDSAVEAAESVRNVLWFMACVFSEGFDFAGDERLIDGAGLIFETCADTLTFHLEQKGGAA